MWKARVTVPQSQGSRVTTPMIKELVTWEESVSRPVNLYRALKGFIVVHARWSMDLHKHMTKAQRQRR